MSVGTQSSCLGSRKALTSPRSISSAALCRKRVLVVVDASGPPVMVNSCTGKVYNLLHLYI